MAIVVTALGSGLIASDPAVETFRVDSECVVLSAATCSWTAVDEANAIAHELLFAPNFEVCRSYCPPNRLALVSETPAAISTGNLVVTRVGISNVAADDWLEMMITTRYFVVQGGAHRYACTLCSYSSCDSDFVCHSLGCVSSDGGLAQETDQDS